MKEPYISVVGIAQAETPANSENQGAFCIQNPEYILNGASYRHTGDMWIPKATIMSDSLDTIEEAVRGEEIEIFVAKWWMEDQ